MLELDEAVRAALEQNHIAGYQVTAYYGEDLTVEDVPITLDGSISFDADSDVQGSGSIYVAKTDGTSLVPRTKTDPLAPYGQEVTIDRTITVGDTTWNIPLGRFRIARVPSSKEFFRRYPTQELRASWQVQLELKDRLEMLQADDFLATSAPIPGNSTWDEIQRLSPLPIVQSLPDKALPSSLVYESKAAAIKLLMDNLGGVPHITREGALTARPADTWLTATTPVFTVKGTIDIDEGMSNDLYNSVVATNPDDPTILGVAEITEEGNPLSVNGPLGKRTYHYSTPLATTQSALTSSAQKILARVSTRQSREAVVTCLPRPDIELGDYGSVTDPITGRTIKGEVSGMEFSLNPTAAMTLTLIVAETA